MFECRRMAWALDVLSTKSIRRQSQRRKRRRTRTQARPFNVMCFHARLDTPAHNGLKIVKATSGFNKSQSPRAPRYAINSSQFVILPVPVYSFRKRLCMMISKVAMIKKKNIHGTLHKSTWAPDMHSTIRINLIKVEIELQETQ